MIAATPTTSSARRRKRQWTSKADRFALIANVLREFCCYVSVQEICGGLHDRGYRARDFKVSADLLELIKAGTIERIGEGHRGSPYLYCLISESVPAPPQIFNKLPPPDPHAGAMARWNGRSSIPPRKPTRQPKATDQQIRDAIHACGGNRSVAARRLKVSKQLISQRVAKNPKFFSGLPPMQRGKWARKEILVPQKPAPPSNAHGLNFPLQDFHLKAAAPTQRTQSIPQANRPTIVKPTEPPRGDPPPRPRPKYTPPPAGPDELAQLWQRYCADRSNESLRNALAEHYLPLVNRLAAGMEKKLPDSIELDDLATAGFMGLLQAIAKFDPDRGLKFETYAPGRIRGEMLDYLRQQDWAPRLVRLAQRKLSVAREELCGKLGREPEPAELAEHLAMSQSELGELLKESRTPAQISLNTKFYETDTYRDVCEIDVLQDNRAIRPTRRQSDLDNLREMTKGLNKRDRLIIIMYYWLNYTMHEIGEQLALSESRVCQAHTAIIERMRARMAVEAREAA